MDKQLVQHLKGSDAKARIVNAPKRQHLISLLRQGGTFCGVPKLAVGIGDLDQGEAYNSQEALGGRVRRQRRNYTPQEAQRDRRVAVTSRLRFRELIRPELPAGWPPPLVCYSCWIGRGPGSRALSRALDLQPRAVSPYGWPRTGEARGLYGLESRKRRLLLRRRPRRRPELGGWGWRVPASGEGVPKEESGSRRPGVVRPGGALQLGVGGGERLDLRDNGLAASRAE